jgi:hypothetical protein
MYVPSAPRATGASFGRLEIFESCNNLKDSSARFAIRFITPAESVALSDATGVLSLREYAHSPIIPPAIVLRNTLFTKSDFLIIGNLPLCIFMRRIINSKCN